jgi:hypothetical protein
MPTLRDAAYSGDLDAVKKWVKDGKESINKERDTVRV